MSLRLQSNHELLNKSYVEFQYNVAATRSVLCGTRLARNMQRQETYKLNLNSQPVCNRSRYVPVYFDFKISASHSRGLRRCDSSLGLQAVACRMFAFNKGDDESLLWSAFLSLYSLAPWSLRGSSSELQKVIAPIT